MPDIASVLIRQRVRLREIADVLGRYGFARLADQARDAGDGGRTQHVASRLADPELANLTTGERLRGVLTELGTTWIKLGQMLSLRPDVVGVEVAEALTQLQSSVPADAPGLAEATVVAELGRPLTELFASFDPEPVASGSVAQVHEATLPDGTEAIVKVLHAGAERRVIGDLELMRALADFLESSDPDLARYSPSSLVAQFEEMMRSAIDFTDELDSMRRIGANFADEPDVVIPEAFQTLSTRQVLTMSRMSGHTFTDRASVEASGWEVDEIVRRATEIYLEMILRDGVYHADPHPGNFLLPDGDHIIILDFGDVGRLSARRRQQLETLLMAVSTKDADDLLEALVDITEPPADADLERLSDDIDAWMGRYLQTEVGQLDIAGMITSGLNTMHTSQLSLPAELSLLFRTILLLQGLGQQIGAEAHLDELAKPYLRDLMAKRLDPRDTLRRGVRSARTWNRLLATLPEDLRELRAQLRDGNLRIDFQLHDPDEKIDHLVDGLLASASVLAASQLMSRQTRPLVGSVSLPGVVAVTIGITTWRRLRGNRTSYVSVGTRAVQLVRSLRS